MKEQIPEFDVKPDWKPLESVIDKERLADFMHMGRVGTIQLYKHRTTRRYINIDAITGVCFQFENSGYYPVGRNAAIEQVLGESVILKL